MKDKNISIQELLSLGYVYLLILGILSDTIYFYFLEINILAYSSVLDVLISPLALLAKNVIIPIALLVSVAAAYYWVVIIVPKLHNKLKHKKWYQKTNDIEKLDKKYAEVSTTYQLIMIGAIFVMFFFLGIGIGLGTKYKSKIAAGEIETDHRITFSDEQVKEVKVLGQNSMYLFYIKPNDKKVTISPISQNIKEIQRLEKEK